VTTAVLGGVRLAYDVQGTGEPLLLIQGLGYGRGGWGPARGLLAERFQVVSFDNRGAGESDVPSGPYTTAQLAGDALAVLDAVEIDGANVIGLSLGGMVAQELVLARPERVRKLVLCSTTPGGATSFPMPEQTVALMTRAPALDPREALHRFVVNALAPDPPAELVQEIVAYRVANPPDPAGWRALAGAGAAHDALGRLSAIQVPTLVVHGTADNVVDVRNARLFADAIEGVRLELFEGVGHLLPWERPQEFTDLVAEFFT
jgi:pimeloyl-ACP methyl ester carboxylesterase